MPPALRRTWVGALVRWLARPAGLSAAAVAPGVASYTAVLLSQTAVPAWHEAHPYLPFVFTGSAAASGGGWGMVLAPVAEAGPARRLAVVGPGWRSRRRGCWSTGWVWPPRRTRRESRTGCAGGRST
ncbi:putative formate-dependent nitrite reductase, membrane component, NrfD [Mycobacterium kansasii 824]|nr:putative formate-dependent nitrite reductase, membrane component, NrfD [Mycobacterium kansasii 824]